MKKILVLCLVSTFMSFSQTTFLANNPNINYYGRVDFTDSLKPAYSWPGIAIEANFTGKTISAALIGDGNVSYEIIIDNENIGKFTVNSGEKTYLLAENLSEGSHHIILKKRNETNWSENIFLGFILDKNETLLDAPQKPKLKMEFIGDSYVVGYGNESEDRENGSFLEHTNSSKSFGALTAEHFNAEYMINAYSGLGLVRNANGSRPGFEFSSYYPYTIHSRVEKNIKEPLWDYSIYIPALVVIHFGINDFNGVAAEPADTLEFIKIYEELIEDLRSKYVNTKFICMSTAIWPNDYLKKSITSIINNQKAKGFNDVYTLHYSVNAEALHWHPSLDEHKYIADKLINLIESENILRDTSIVSSVHIDNEKKITNVNIKNIGNGVFQLNSEIADNYKLSILSVDGRIVFASTLKNNDFFNVSHLSKGQYILKINSLRNNQTKAINITL